MTTVGPWPSPTAWSVEFSPPWMTRMMPLWRPRSSTRGMLCESGKRGRMRRIQGGVSRTGTEMREPPPFQSRVRPRRGKQINAS